MNDIGCWEYVDQSLEQACYFVIHARDVSSEAKALAVEITEARISL